MSGLDRKSSIGLLMGRPGSGKSWSLVRYLVDEWIPDHTGPFYTNVPIKPEAIADYCEQHYGIDRAKTLQRVFLIPDDETFDWMEGKSSPKEYFENLYDERIPSLAELKELDIDPDDIEALEGIGVIHPLNRAMVVLDEAGSYFPAKPAAHQKDMVHNVGVWLSKIRHHGARIIFCSQNEMQIAAGIRRMMAFQIHLTDLGDDRDPITGTLISDWLQFGAKYFLFRYIQFVREQEFIGMGSDFEPQEAKIWQMRTVYFNLYESRNLEGGGAGKEEEMEWERFGFIRFFKWFVTRNLWGFSKIAFYIFLVAVLLWPYPGAMYAWQWGRSKITEIMTGDFIDVETVQKEGEPEGQGGEAKKDQVPQLDHKTATEETLVQANQLLRDQLEEATTLLDAVEAEREELEAEKTRLEEEAKAASQIILMTPKQIILRNGDRVNVGEKIEIGPYEGQQLKGVDTIKQLAVLDSGDLLRLWKPGLSDFYDTETLAETVEAIAENPTETVDDVRGSLPKITGEPIRRAANTTIERIQPGKLLRQ